MTVYKVENRNSISHLYQGWEETMIYTYLQGYLGEAYVVDVLEPKSAVIIVAEFAFFAGEAKKELLTKTTLKGAMLAPSNEGWEALIKEVFPNAVRHIRYATKKEPDVFNVQYLNSIINTLPTKYELQLIDASIYQQIIQESWSKDLCSNFKEYEEYQEKGLGVVILYHGKVIAGASSYTVYNEGIEIEIDTKREYRRQGLASICGAKIIIECLKRGKYPSWDAHNKASLMLSEKLGYHFDKEYPVYMF